MAIRLARRLQRVRPSPTVSITAKALSLRERGHDIISLSAGEPDFDTPSHIRSAAVDAIARGETKYTAVDGTRLLKQAIVEKFARDNRLQYGLEQVLVTSGAKQACFNLCQAILNAGDEAIIPAPYWVSYPDMVRLADAEPVIVHTSAESGFRMSPEQLSGAITARTRLVILNSPCNPTGSVYTRNDLEQLGLVLQDHPLIVILADDIYEHICWDAEPFSTFAEVCPSLFDRTVTVNGLSKSYAMCGWRVGYAAGAEGVIAAMTTLQSQSTTNACSIAQAAARAALVGDQSCVAEMRAVFRNRHDAVHSSLVTIPGVECQPGLGAFYLLPKIESALLHLGLSSDVEFCDKLLDEQGLALVPGSAFGAPGHVRISYAASETVLTEALRRLALFVTR